MPVKIVDNIMRFARNNADAMDRALGNMSIDIERLAKMTVPFKQGPLRSSGHGIRTALLKHKVVFEKEYARFQEFGGDARRRVRHYSRPGSKAHYLKDAGDEVTKKAVDYIKREAMAVRA